jgi:DNA replication protein DnaC
VALALGLVARQKGFSVPFTTAASLVNQLMEARDERRLLKLRCDLQAVRLLIVDEFGYVPLSPTGAELLFEAFSQSYERGLTIVTSNLPFEDWTSVLGSERLSRALLHRLTHHVSTSRKRKPRHFGTDRHATVGRLRCWNRPRSGWPTAGLRPACDQLRRSPS